MSSAITKTETASAESSSPEDRAIQILAPINFHQCLWVPQTESHAKLRVTYSLTSNFHDETLPTILFPGPMFGCRYLGVMFDKLAQTVGVRVICVDRPGIGGSTPAPVEQRIEIWLETVPALLQRLNVKHVSLVTHSAGTLYTLNTLARLREVLDPKAPYVAFLGPWVHTEHSGVTLLNVASKLPSGVLSYWAGLAQFVNENIAPSVSWSGGIVSSVTGAFQAAPQTGDSSDNDAGCGRKYGVDESTGKEIEKLSTKYIFAEGLTGGNDEARLLLKIGKGRGSWGMCEDFRAFVSELVESEKGKPGATDAGASRKLTVRANFAASDMMIGKKGKEYFEECWRQDGVEDVIDFGSKQWPETNHETVLLDLEKGPMRPIFEEIRRLHDG